MKTLIWVLFAVLVLGWTGLAAVSVQLTDWLFAAMASGQAGQAVGGVVGAAGGLANWPVPAWLALWVSPEMIEGLQASWTAMLAWLSAIAPSAAGLSGLVSALVWVFWGLGALTLLGIAVLLHWLVGRMAGTSKAGPARLGA